jgi:oligopeptidase B
MKSSLLIGAMIVTSHCTSPSEMQNITPPVAKQVPHELTIHGVTRVDPYFWMNERDNSDVIAYLEAENDYLKASLAHTEKFQELLFEEMKGKIQETDESVPYFKNGYFYYHTYAEGSEYPIYCRRKGSMDAHEEVMLNVNDLAKNYDYYSVGLLQVSPDNKILAYAADTVGRYIMNLSFKNLETGETYPYTIANITSMAWANDNKTLFYGSKDLQTLRADRIFRHTLGDPSSDKEVYFESDDSFSTQVNRTKSGAYITIACHSTVSSEYRLIDSDNPLGEPRVFQTRERDHLYYVDHKEDSFYVLTNVNATNFKLVTTPRSSTSKVFWRDLIPHRDDVLIEAFDLFANHLVVQERSMGLNRLRVINQSTNHDQYIDFNEPTYYASLGTNPEFNTTTLRYNYESLTTPVSTFDYDMTAHTTALLKQQPVLGGFDKDNYVSERIWATATDGSKVPISLVYRKGLTRDGNNPAYLTGYGSYGFSYDVYFSSARLSLLDRGVLFAIAHIRGGQEMGRKWYEDGKLLNKMNTFTDFTASAEHLIAQGYTSNNKLFAEGASAGGLLMGAVVNKRPDLFKGIIIGVPFVDVITTMLDETIPLTTVEYDEWGNPNDATFFNYMLQYSPYDNIKAQEYPAMLVTTAYHDSQVQYWEPAKWVAKLRTLKTDSNPLFMRTEMAASHGGKSGRFESLRLTALEYAFIFDQIGITR